VNSACQWECSQGMKSPLSSGGKIICFSVSNKTGNKMTTLHTQGRALGRLAGGCL